MQETQSKLEKSSFVYGKNKNIHKSEKDEELSI